MSTDELLEELQRTAHQIDNGIIAQVEHLKRTSWFMDEWLPGDEYRAMGTNGRPILLDALTAKAGSDIRAALTPKGPADE